MTKATIQTIVETPPSQEENSPAVLAYRVGQLEKAVTGGIGELKDEIKNLTTTFAPQAYVLELKNERDRQLKVMQLQIDDHKKDTDIRFDRLWTRSLALATLVVAIMGVIAAFLLLGRK